MSTASQIPYLPDSPYPGITPYGFAHRNAFFAREIESRKLIRLVVQYRGVLLYSDSGTGKSSLLNAGLIPLAMEEGFQPERIRVQPRREEEFVVERISCEVGDKGPFLPSVFSPDEDQKRIVLSAERFMETLRAAAGAVRPLLIFDQFEEWITLFEESSAGQGSNGVRASRESIRDAIISLINDITLPVKVLIALREDYLAKLIPFFQRCPSLPDQYLRLDSLSGEQIYQAILGPFERYPGRYRPELTSELAREIQRQFEERSRASDIRLTEVQIVCQGLFESGKEGKDLEEFFTKEGGVKGILEHYLERRLELLPLDQQEPAVGLLTRMVTSAGTRNVISRDDLLKRVELEDEIKPEVLTETLDNLEQNTKLLRRERRREVYFYEIASEFLVEWIRKKAQEWQRLMDRKKLEEAQRRIEEQAKTTTLFRRFIIALVIVSLLAVAAAVVAWMAYDRAIEQARIAKEQTSIALSERERAEVQARIAEKQALIADEQTRIAHSERKRAEVQAHIAEKQAHIAEEQTRIALSERERSEEQARIAEKQARIAEEQTHIALSERERAEEQARIAEEQARIAEKQARIAFSGQLVTQSFFKMDGELDLALLLSVEATRIADNVESRASLLSSLQKNPGLFKLFQGHKYLVNSVSFSPDGKLLASGSRDKTIRLWDVATGKALGAPLTGHKDSVESVSFSPDGKLLASGSYDRTIRLWDVSTGKPLGQPLTGHKDSVESVSFSPDGKLLASGSSDSTIRLWDMSLESWQARACSIANRNLTLEEWRQYMGDTPYRRTCPDLPPGKGVEVPAEKAGN